MISALAALSTVMIALAVRRHSTVDGRVQFNAFLFFSCGFFYYWTLPLIFAATAQHLDIEEVSLAANIVDQIDDGPLVFFAWMCVASYGAFWFAYSRFVRPPPQSASATLARFEAPQRGLKGLVVLAVLLATATAIPVRHHFFKGYYEELFEGYAEGVVADALPRGTFVASVSMLFVVCFMWSAQATSGSRRIRDFLTSTPMLIYYLFQILVVSMGGRLYLASNALSLLAYMSLRFGLSIRPSRLATYIFAGMTLAGLVGVLRAEGGISFAGILTNVGQEPALTSVSLFSFLDAGDFPALAFPKFLLSDFVNLLPSFLFPEKTTWLLRPQDSGFVINMPFGGLHLFVSLIVNFGWVGSVVIFSCIGVSLALLQGAVGSWLGCVVYCMVAGWMGFTVFRDPMSVSIVKNVFQVSVLWPLIVTYLLRVISQLSVRSAIRPGGL